MELDSRSPTSDREMHEGNFSGQMLEVIMGMLDPRSLARCTAVSRVRPKKCAHSGTIFGYQVECADFWCILEMELARQIRPALAFSVQASMEDKVYHSLADRMRMPKGYYT
eukprot:1110981-Amorphochlora_amoeboformis.AAC.1